MRPLALGAVLGPILFTLAWIVFGILQPPVHNMYGVMGGLDGAVSNPISGLGVGPMAVVVNAAFILCGLMTALGVIGFTGILGAGRPAWLRWLCAAVLMLSPLGLVLAGIFTLATSVAWHSLGAALLFVTPVVGFIIAGIGLRDAQGRRPFGGRLWLAAPLTLGLLVLFATSFNLPHIAAGQGVAGLTERALILEIQAWYVALGLGACRR
jgi:hypothetical membrane protein